jgi:hypothetical protein
LRAARAASNSTDSWFFSLSKIYKIHRNFLK